MKKIRCPKCNSLWIREWTNVIWINIRYCVECHHWEQIHYLINKLIEKQKQLNPIIQKELNKDFFKLI